MILILEVTSAQRARLGGASRQTFDTCGGSIGRDNDNSWVLPHAKVSGHHALISYSDGVYYIEDTSRNGICLNSIRNRLERGRPHPLTSGDRVLIEPYEIEVTIGRDEHEAAGRRAAAPPEVRPSDRSFGSNPFESDDPFAPRPFPSSGLDAPEEAIAGQEVDPLALLNLAPPKRAPARKPPRARDLDRGSLLDGHFQPPDVLPDSASVLPGNPSAIPEDYDPLAPIPQDYDPLAPDNLPVGEPPPPPVADVVNCTVFAPPTALEGQSVMVQVFAYRAEDYAIVRNLADEYDNRARSRGSRELDQEVDRGAELTFVLSMSGVAIDECVQTLVWRGRPASVQFGVSLPADLGPRDIVGTVLVTHDSIPFGHVKFVLGCRVDSQRRSQDHVGRTDQHGWKRYEYAFISYASPDRSEVLKRVQMLARCRVEFFQDLLHLEPGERWQRSLYRMIDKSDVFFLFWSSAAKTSEWVLREIRYALERKAGDELAAPEIIPIIIEGPPPVPPPTELSDLHFNDPFIYFIQAQ